MDYEIGIKAYYLCKQHEAKTLLDNERIRKPTYDEKKDQNCCHSAAGAEYPGATVRTWTCGAEPSQVIEVSELEPV